MEREAFVARHPYWFVVILELVIIGVYLVAGTIASIREWGGFALYVAANIGLTATATLLLTRMRWWHRIGFRPLAEVGDLRYFAIPLVPALLNLLPGVTFPGWLPIAGFLALALMVGFVEEVFFRGLMLQGLWQKGLTRAITISTLLFGGTHLMNALAGRGAVDIVTQLGDTLAIGFAFTMVVIRTRVIWPLIAIHALIDFVAFLPSDHVVTDNEMIVRGVGITTLFLIYGLWLYLGTPGVHDRQQQRLGMETG